MERKEQSCPLLQNNKEGLWIYYMVFKPFSYGRVRRERWRKSSNWMKKSTSNGKTIEQSLCRRTEEKKNMDEIHGTGLAKWHVWKMKTVLEMWRKGRLRKACSFCHVYRTNISLYKIPKWFPGACSRSLFIWSERTIHHNFISPLK